jgi:hypothetical protein
MVVKASQAVDVVEARVGEGSIVAEHDHLDTLQAHDAVSLRPAAVVADRHAEDAAECAKHGEA